MELGVETSSSRVERSKALSRGMSGACEAILLERTIDLGVFLKVRERIRRPAKCVCHILVSMRYNKKH